MIETDTTAAELRRSGSRLVQWGIGAVVAILALAAVFLFMTLPDANAFNARVERIFVENDALTSAAEIKLLEILALSGTAFSETLTSYRMVIFVLLVFAASLLIATLVFLVMLVTLNRRMAQIEHSGIQVSSLLISRDEKTVYLNNMGFRLTDAAIETLCVLAEARMDEEVLTGAQIEAMISGRSEADCEEAAGATRIKRLRDGLGNQLVSALLVVGLLLSIPWTFQGMKDYKYQNLESTFAAAISTGQSQEGSRTRSGQVVGVVDEQAMASFIRANVTRRGSILTDNAQTYAVMLFTGRPDLFFDRVDQSDGPWLEAAADPAEHVDYMLLSTDTASDLLSGLYPEAAAGRHPSLTTIYTTARYTLVGVPAGFTPGGTVTQDASEIADQSGAEEPGSEEPVTDEDAPTVVPELEVTS